MLRPYQDTIAGEACALLQQYGIAYLSMQVRTGKTLTALEAAHRFRAKSVLFVTKKKAIGSIEDDYNKLGPTFTLQITNYESLHLVEGLFDLFILDEAHCLGQFPSPAKKVKVLKKMAEGKPIIYLSGTPTPESYSQLYHQFYCSSFTPFPESTFYKWAAKYVTIKKRYFFNRQINDYSFADKDAIDKATHHLFISFTQSEAGFDVPVTEVIHHVNMKAATYNLIDRLKKDRVYTSAAGHEILADTEVKLMNKMHQIYSGTVISEAGVGVAFDDTKVRYIKKKFAGKKIAIFYKFRAEEELLRKTFPLITTSPEEFNARHAHVFISQIQSGREGINLSTADCLVMMNLDFSAVSYWQSRARLQALHRESPADVHWVFATGGIEDKIYDRVLNKRDYVLSYFIKDFGIERIRDTAVNYQST